MKSAILINKSGDTEEIKINKITPNCISRCFKVKGKGKSEHLNKWVYNGMNINMYGYEDGEAGNENKFELPPPIEDKLFFGDLLFVFCDSKNNLQELSMEKFIEFYNETMGGFEDIEDTEDEEESEDEDESDESFIVKDDEYETGDSDWKPQSNEESSTNSDSESESYDSEHEDEEEDDEEEDDEGEDDDEEDDELEILDQDNDSQDSKESISILLYNYKNKDNLDELISSSDNSEELSEEEIDEEEIKKLFEKVSVSKKKINMKIKDKQKEKEKIILEDIELDPDTKPTIKIIKKKKNKKGNKEDE
jgi:hypothetical protein